MEETIEYLRDLQRQLNSVEHMIYVSCKFTRTTEMLRKVMETIVLTYERFFGLTYQLFVGDEKIAYSVHDKIQLLSESLANRGIYVDLSDYFLLKRLLISDFNSVGEYRKNLCMISYIDGEEYIINMQKLLSFYDNLKIACNGLNSNQ